MRLSTLCIAALVGHGEKGVDLVSSAPPHIRRLCLEICSRHDLLTAPLVARLLSGSDTSSLDLAAVSVTEQLVSSCAASSAKPGSRITRLDLSRTPASAPLYAWRRLAAALVESLSVLDLSQSAAKGLLASFASRCTSLRTIKAEGCLQVTDSDVITLLQNCPQLQDISFRRCSQLTNKCIVKGLPERSFLLRLDLRDCRKMGDPVLFAIADRCPTLLTLSLEGQRFPLGGITRVLNSCSELESLAVPCCTIDESALLLTRNTRCRVRDLDLFGSMFSEATLLFLFGNVFRNLRRLNIAGVRHLSITVFRYICQRSPGLRSLSLKGHLASVNDFFLEEIALHLHQLEGLDLGLCRALTNDGIFKLMQRLPVALRELGLVCLPVVQDNVIALVAERFGSRLEKLSIGGCCSVSDVGLAALVEHCSLLRSLCLKGTSICSSRLLEKLIARNPDLRSLSLSGVKAVNDHVLVVLDASLSQLSNLYLSGVK